ncbi:hypothetical protein L1987_74331 [Smallanthus sonchifolius]|uniref:Uncharacterized protein n=1 Tax=Smallanthus sonchifolius TaxID=185202 RepID=A0ACB9A3Y4_9ASTR|nr:hypothetical protein L1987_74331 [Smallanthus sonchifolius]
MEKKELPVDQREILAFDNEDRRYCRSKNRPSAYKPKKYSAFHLQYIVGVTDPSHLKTQKMVGLPGVRGGHGVRRKRWLEVDMAFVGRSEEDGWRRWSPVLVEEISAGYGGDGVVG